MPLLSDTALAKSIRSGNIQTVYYFYGKDTAVISKYTDKLITKLVGKDRSSLNLHMLDGRALVMSELWDCCNMLPCFADRVVVAINDLNCDKLAKEDLEYLLSIVSDVPETTTVIFYATGVELYKNRKSLTDRNDKLLKLCTKLGEACEFSFKTPAELSKLIEAGAKKSGCGISVQDASYLAQLCLCEQQAINSELSKLTAYAQGRDITREDIDLLCSRRLDADVFRLSGYILKRNSDAAFRLISELYDMQADATQIIGAMTNSFCDIYRARAAMPQGKSASDIAADFSYPKNREFAIKYAVNDCRSISEERIRRCITALSEADMLSKSSRMESRIILERCVTLMLEK